MKYLFDVDHCGPMIIALFLFEVALGFLIIDRVPYTEIDWIAYMQEVEGVLSGEMDYSKLKGDTGPLVYPAGFVYLYIALHWITNNGVNIRLAQHLFHVLYLAVIAVVCYLYSKARILPPWAYVLICASRRIHSIFMLRLFNDCWAMLLVYIAFALFIKNRWSLGCVFFSLAVSVKMNILLFAPPLLFLLWRRFGFVGALPKLAICASLQVALGMPFLLTFPRSYMLGAFDFGRQFTYIWTVNLKFLPEELFLNKQVALGLLVAHVTGLLVFLHLQNPKGLLGTFVASLSFPGVPTNPFTARELLITLFVGNFVGIACARSLHYQFYVWYYHTLPFMLFLVDFGGSKILANFLRVLMLAAIELCWNIYPSTFHSSLALTGLHGLLLIGLFLQSLKQNREATSVVSIASKKQA